MSKIPPKKRKQAGKSLRRICGGLKLPFHKTKRGQLADAHSKSLPQEKD